MRETAIATEGERSLDQIRLLAETGFVREACALAASRAEASPADPETIGLMAHLHHRSGAISEAIEAWRHLRVGSGASLARLLELSNEEKREPHLQRTDFLLVRRALRLAAEGRHDRAAAACSHGQLIASASGDREQLKLLTLLGSMLDELAGRLPEASTALERLGADAAYAHDADRLSLLARIYERRLDLDGRRKAERVLAFLAGIGKLSAFPRLIATRRLLGDEAGARDAERAFEEAFCRRMHWLEPGARLAAASQRYVPVNRLGTLPLPEPESAGDELQRGIALLVRGKPGLALQILPAEAHAWRAATLFELGIKEQAIQAAGLAVLERAEPDEPLARLLAATLSASPTARIPSDALELALLALRRTVATQPAGPRSLRSLAVLEERAGNVELAGRLIARADAARLRPWPPPGVVRAAAVYALPGKPKGLVHDVIARRFEVEGAERGKLLDREIHGSLAEGVRTQIHRTFAAVKESLAARFPERVEDFERWGYGLHLTKEDEPSGGPSLELPVAAAFASILLDVRVPSHLVFSGALSYDGAGRIAVRKVGEIGLKLKATLHAGASCLVLPASQREEAMLGAEVPSRIAARSILPVGSLDDVLSALKLL